MYPVKHPRPPNLVLSVQNSADITLDKDDASPIHSSLMLDSDDDVDGDIDGEGDDLAEDFKVLEQLRKSVQKNLRLRPIRSIQRLPKVHLPDVDSLSISPPSSSSWRTLDSSSNSTTDTDTSADSNNTEDTEDDPAFDDEEPQSAISMYFTPLSEYPYQSFASRPEGTHHSQEPSSISPTLLSSLLNAPQRPLLVDTRPLPEYMEAHIEPSVNLAIPSLILKRTRKHKIKTSTDKPATAFSSLHSLRQFITTDASLAIWDSFLVPVSTPTSAESSLIVKSTLWNGDVIVYDSDMCIEDRDNANIPAWTLISLLRQLLVDLPTTSVHHSASIYYLEGGFSAVTQHAELGSFISIGGEAASNFSGPQARETPDLGTNAMSKRPNGLFQLDTQSLARSKTLPEIDLSSSATSTSAPTFIPSPQSQLQDTSPRSPLPIMPAATCSSSAVSPMSPHPLIPAYALNNDSDSPSPPPSQAHLAFRKPLPPPSSSARRPSVPNLRRIDTKSAERLPRLQVKTSGIGIGGSGSVSSGGIPGKPGRSATLSVPPSAIGHPGPHQFNRPGMLSPTDSGLLYAGEGMSVRILPSPSGSVRLGGNCLTVQTGLMDPDKDRLTPYFTPPHSPGTPKAADSAHDDILPPSPRTARPEVSCDTSPYSGFPSHTLPSLPQSPSAPSFPRSPSSSSFSVPSPPRTTFGESFEFNQDGGAGTESDGPPTTEDPHPPFTISTILPLFLYLGPEPSTQEHLAMLKDLSIKRILNIAAECDQDDHGLRLAENFERYTKIAMRDHVEEEGVGSKVREVCDILDDARLHSAPTYVHCKAGKSRSVTATIAYLIHANHWTLSQAYTFVLERRKGISPNIGFVSELMTFEEEELGGKSVGVQPSASAGGSVGGGETSGRAEGGHGYTYYGVTAAGRRGGHVRESLPPAFTTSMSSSVTDSGVSGFGNENGEAMVPMSAGGLTVGYVRAEVGQDVEIKDSQGRWRHARRAPVDEQTLQPLRRVSKAGLESSVDA